MYGLLVKGAVTYLMCSYPQVGATVLEELGFSEQQDLDQYQIYSDKLFSRITKLMSERVGVSEEELLENFGEYFVEYTIKCGYGDLLFSLGRSISDLINELDNLVIFIPPFFLYLSIKIYCSTNIFDFHIQKSKHPVLFA